MKLCRRKGIHDLHFHDLCHDAPSRLFDKELNPVEVATITGNKDTRMLMRYNDDIRNDGNQGFEKSETSPLGLR